MGINAAQKPIGIRPGVDADLVRVGKDVIEILTSGMYVSPVTIYREYLQNAVDLIDSARSQGLIATEARGRVSIDLDHSARSAVIRDTGAGLNARSSLSTLLSIGASPKRGTTARGFRGVGRLSGLAYCRELAFRTKASGDDKVATISWDCRTLRERLQDVAYSGDLRDLISEVVTVSYDELGKKTITFLKSICVILLGSGTTFC